MPETQVRVSEVLGELKDLAPAGYALGFHIQFTTTKFLFQTYRKEWLDFYSQQGLVMADPIVAWCFENTGKLRWSDLNDPEGVLDQAANYGLRYGIVCATDVGGTRSMGGFSRSDREFTDAEMDQVFESFEKLHVATADQASLTDDTVQQLKKMSVMVTHPGS